MGRIGSGGNGDVDEGGCRARVMGMWLGAGGMWGEGMEMKMRMGGEVWLGGEEDENGGMGCEGRRGRGWGGVAGRDEEEGVNGGVRGGGGDEDAFCRKME